MVFGNIHHLVRLNIAAGGDVAFVTLRRFSGEGDTNPLRFVAGIGYNERNAKASFRVKIARSSDAHQLDLRL